MIQIGSQEKRLGETSSITRSKPGHSALGSQPKPGSQHPSSSPRTTHGDLALGQLPPNEELPRSVLPMREPPSDQSEREQRCCISSDAEGRIWTSFPPLSHPLSIRPVPESFYHLEHFDSENTGTAIARVGRAISPVPPSQKAENAVWHEWVGQPSSPVSSHVAIEGSRTSLDHRVSPGVSEVQRPEQEPQEPPPFLPQLGGFMAGELNHASASELPDVNKLLSSSNSSEILCRYEELVAKLRRLEQLDNSIIQNPPIGSLAKTRADHPDIVEGFGEERDSVSTSGPSQESSVVAGIGTRDQRSAATCETGVFNPECMPDDNSDSQSPLVVSQTCKATGEIDPDEAWKTFVFGDDNSDEIGKAAFEEAKHDAAQTLRPSNTPDSSSSFKSDGNSNIATVGTLYTHQDRQTSDSDSGDVCSLAGEPSGQKATYGQSLAETGPDAPLSNCDIYSQPPSVDVNVGTSSPSRIDVSINTSETNELESLEQADISSESHAAAPSMATSMAVVPAVSEIAPSEMSNMAEHFRFSQPKLFVGSRSNLPLPGRIVEHGVGSMNFTKRKRGRPKKRANDGRADIRALPNYSSDPIEEFEEERRARKEGRAPESLFPALELS